MFEQLFKCSTLIQEYDFNEFSIRTIMLLTSSKRSFDAMMPYYTDIYGNASSKFYKIGRDAEQALYKLRESVMKSLDAKRKRMILGSGCEADNHDKKPG